MRGPTPASCTLPACGRRVALAAAILCGMGLRLSAGDEDAWVGLSFQMKGVGWSQDSMLLVTSLIISKIDPATPAGQHNLAAGDEVLEVDGTPVAGAARKAIQAGLKKKAGERVVLKVRRRDGQVVSIPLTFFKRAR